MTGTNALRAVSDGKWNILIRRHFLEIVCPTFCFVSPLSCFQGAGRWGSPWRSSSLSRTKQVRFFGVQPSTRLVACGGGRRTLRVRHVLVPLRFVCAVCVVCLACATMYVPANQFVSRLYFGLLLMVSSRLLSLSLLIVLRSMFLEFCTGTD